MYFFATATVPAAASLSLFASLSLLSQFSTHASNVPFFDRSAPVSCKVPVRNPHQLNRPRKTKCQPT